MPPKRMAHVPRRKVWPRTCYDVLELEPNAPADKIGGAWRKAFTYLHTDSQRCLPLTPDELLDRISILNFSRDTLSTPARRAAYDAFLAANGADAHFVPMRCFADSVADLERRLAAANRPKSIGIEDLFKVGLAVGVWMSMNGGAPPKKK